jgi:aryl carrier-like protein
MPAKKLPATQKPEILVVNPLQAVPAQPQAGRPKKLRMPPLPKEIREGMSQIEQDHFDFFIQAVREEHKDLTPVDLICLNMAGLNYINSLRLQQQQLKSGELVTMSRQHPEVQMRAWLDLMSVSRKQRPTTKSAVDQEAEKWRALFGNLEN